MICDASKLPVKIPFIAAVEYLLNTFEMFDITSVNPPDELDEPVDPETTLPPVPAFPGLQTTVYPSG